MKQEQYEEPFAHVVGLDEVSRLLEAKKNAINKMWFRTKRGEGIRYPMPNPIPRIPVPVWWIEDIVRWAERGGYWPEDRKSPAEFLADMGIRMREDAPESTDGEPEVEGDDDPLANEPPTERAGGVPQVEFSAAA